MIIFTTIQIISVTMEITSRSSQLREQGNKAYTSKKNSQALKLYTESVRWVRRRRRMKIDKDGIFNLDFLSHFEIMRSLSDLPPTRVLVKVKNYAWLMPTGLIYFHTFVKIFSYSQDQNHYPLTNSLQVSSASPRTTVESRPSRYPALL